jgi:hypothetical protein
MKVIILITVKYYQIEPIPVDLKGVSFQNVLLLSAVISAGNKNDVYETQTTIALNTLRKTEITPSKIMEIV